jgi:hypothetical protein
MTSHANLTLLIVSYLIEQQNHASSFLRDHKNVRILQAPPIPGFFAGPGALAIPGLGVATGAPPAIPGVAGGTGAPAIPGLAMGASSATPGFFAAPAIPGLGATGPGAPAIPGFASGLGGLPAVPGAPGIPAFVGSP